MPPHSVSVVIPTVGRPELADAIRSVTSQNHAPSEIVLAVDSADDLPTHPASDAKVVRVGPGAGGNAARQAGIEAANGDLIALLDEDDIWHPNRLEVQLGMLTETAATGEPWIATCPVVAMFENGRQETWPSILKSEGESLSEYVLRKRRIVGGVGFVQASTLLFERKLALACAWDPALRFHQDLAWLVAVDEQFPSLRVLQSREPLVDYKVGVASVSRRISSSSSSAWGVQHLGHVDARSRGDFLMTTPVIYARRAGSVKDVWRAMSTARKNGRPGVRATIYAILSIAVAAATRLRRAM